MFCPSHKPNKKKRNEKGRKDFDENVRLEGLTLCKYFIIDRTGTSTDQLSLLFIVTTKCSWRVKSLQILLLSLDTNYLGVEHHHSDRQEEEEHQAGPHQQEVTACSISGQDHQNNLNNETVPGAWHSVGALQHASWRTTGENTGQN